METGIEKAVRLAGNQTALANLVGVTPQAIQKWVAQGKPSPEGCKQIEICLNGQVTRHELDPDLFGPLPIESTRTPTEEAEPQKQNRDHDMPELLRETRIGTREVLPIDGMME